VASIRLTQFVDFQNVNWSSVSESSRLYTDNKGLNPQPARIIIKKKGNGNTIHKPKAYSLCVIRSLAVRNCNALGAVGASFLEATRREMFRVLGYISFEACLDTSSGKKQKTAQEC
jgi:hypothetical protein